MTTQTKSPLTIIIVIAILLFIASIIWKNFQTDNSEEINIPVITKTTPKDIKKPEIIEDTLNVQSTNANDDVEYRTKQYESKVYKIKMLDTPERTIRAIKYYKSINDEDKVNEYTDWLIENFPDYEYEG